jgi:hypothetical protein
MVWRRRSTAAGLRHPELVVVDWELPSSFGLTRRRRKPWRSFGDTRTDSRWPLATARVLAGARVSVTARNIGGRRRNRLLGLIHGGGSLFIDVQRRRRSSSTSRKRRQIGRLQELHRAASQLEVEDDRRGTLGWTAGLGVGPAWTSARWAAARLVFPSFFLLLFFSIISCFLFCYF